jgi:hypothetical protein
MQPGRQAVYAHSMWRTGSTALARCFLDSERYLVFYEPFHEDIPLYRGLVASRAGQAKRSRDLGHPAFADGYFAAFSRVDPRSGRPLHALAPRGPAIRDTYDGLTPAASAYLDACIRTARAANRIAFFGFCRSGLQAMSLGAGEPGAAFHLARDPVSQFRSYRWPENDYFLPGTLMQLLHSRPLAPVVRRLLRRRWRPLHDLSRTLRRGPSPMLTHRVGRRVARLLSGEEALDLFLLSHLATGRAAARAGLPRVTIDDLCADGEQRAAFEAQHGVSLAGLHPNANPDRTLAARIHAGRERITRLLDDLTDV